MEIKRSVRKNIIEHSFHYLYYACTNMYVSFSLLLLPNTSYSYIEFNKNLNSVSTIKFIRSCCTVTCYDKIPAILDD